MRLLREIETLVREFRHLEQDVANGEMSESLALKRIARDIEPLERVVAAS